MSLSNDSHLTSSSHFSKEGCCKKGNWSGRNIAAMVIGFVLFWPIGLVLLYWNISGRDIKDFPDAVRDKWEIVFGNKQQGSSQSGNVVFNEYQQTQYDRIKELKEEIKDRAQSFSAYRSDAKRRADEKEFKDFMSNNPKS